MAAVLLNKSALQQQRDKLQLFERFLPSLDLKRQQLSAEYKKAEESLADAEQGVDRASRSVASILPILGSSSMKLTGLVRIRRIDITEEDVLGLRLPILGAIEFEETHYSLLATPFWVDDLVLCLKEAATQRIRLQIYRERVARMHGAVRRVSQRVNLFDKVLIPEAKQNIAHIQIFLSDFERAAVVTSKITKTKRSHEQALAGSAAREVR